MEIVFLAFILMLSIFLGFELINNPLTFGQLTHQCTVAVKQIEVFKTIAFRGPDKLLAMVGGPWREFAGA